MFGDEECGNRDMDADGGGLTRNNNKKRVQKFFKPICVNSVTNPTDEIEVSMIFLAVKFFGEGCK